MPHIHTTEPFEIDHIKEKVDTINDFEEYFAAIIEDLVKSNLKGLKEHQMREAVSKVEGSSQLKEGIIQEKLKTLWDDPSVKEQFIIWKLAYGMTFMCIKLLVLIDEYNFLQEKMDTWIDVIEKRRE